MIHTTKDRLCNSSVLDRYCLIFFIVLLTFFITTPGHTTESEYQLQINFFFDSESIPNKQVSGYRLYREDREACLSTQVEPQQQSIECAITCEPGTYNFTLSVLFGDNTESPKSPPFPYTLALTGDVSGDGKVDLKDVITGLQVISGIRPSQLNLAGDVNKDGRIGLAEVIYSLNNT